MIPWTLEYFMEVLYGKGTSEESRLHNLLQLNKTGAPDFKTNQKLFDPENLPLRSTYEAYGLGFVHEFISSPYFKELPEHPRFSQIIELYDKFEKEYANHPKLATGANFNASIIHSFPRLITTILCIECWKEGEIKDCPIYYYGTKELAEYLAKDPSDALEIKQSAFELNVFINYFAAAELDMAEWESKFELMTPVNFIPSSAKGRVIYPMETFWTWLRSTSGHARWTDLADSLGTTTAMLSKYRKTDAKQNLPSLPSYSQLRTFLRNRWPQVGLRVEMQKYWQIQMAYGVARIMQEHSERNISLVTQHFCRTDRIEDFYLARIEACKKWMQGLPLHPLFER
ncbi:MAG: hypothetical protein ACPGSB_09340 [Opitutales bacterium]